VANTLDLFRNRAAGFIDQLQAATRIMGDSDPSHVKRFDRSRFNPSRQASPNIRVGLGLNYYLAALYRAEFPAVNR